MSNFNQSYTGLRDDLLKYIEGRDLRILDVGCATGTNGRYLLDHGIASTVVGIEYDPAMGREAGKFNSQVFIGDLNDSDFRKGVMQHTKNFDFILFGDILEHLYDPLDVLSDFVSKLDTTGRVIVSLPNIAHVELFVQVFIKGRWPQNSRGIFDRTHLRWFTKKDAIDIVEESGLKLIEYIPKFRARDALGSQFTWKTKLIKSINPTWVTFQHILICEHN